LSYDPLRLSPSSGDL